MKKTISRILFASCLIGVAGGAAFAGAHSSWEVYVDLQYLTAIGNLASAHNSADTAQRIECQYAAYASGGSVYCYARDAQGNSLACSSWEHPHQWKALAGMSDDSLVYFRAAGDGTCSFVSVSHSSLYGSQQ